EKRGARNLEDAFIGYLLEASQDHQDPGSKSDAEAQDRPDPAAVPVAAAPASEPPAFSLGRLMSYCWRESLELRRDPIRATLALAGSLILMLVIGFGINLDVEDLSYAVLDRDQT